MRSAALALFVLAAGCGKPGGPAPPANPAPAAAANDYRQLSAAELTALIKSKTDWDVLELKPAGANKFSGTVKSPDGTTTLPLTVAVEAGQITAESKSPAGTLKATITPRGVQSSVVTP